jgi:putative flippase GtrA
VSAATIGRMARCLTVSVGTTILSAVILAALAVGLGVPAGLANVIAVLCGIGPSYLGNRHWVWKRDGRGDLAREVVPFWVLSIAGLIISTIAVARVGALSHAWPATARAIALPLANLAGFGALWCVQFVVLDRVIFHDRRAARVQAGGV